VFIGKNYAFSYIFDFIELFQVAKHFNG